MKIKKMIELHNAQLLCRPPPDYEENALPKHLWLSPTLKNLVHPPHCSCSCSLDTIPNNLAEAPSTSVTLLPPVWFRSLSPMCQPCRQPRLFCLMSFPSISTQSPRSPTTPVSFGSREATSPSFPIPSRAASWPFGQRFRDLPSALPFSREKLI